MTEIKIHAWIWEKRKNQNPEFPIQMKKSAATDENANDKNFQTQLFKDDIQCLDEENCKIEEKAINFENDFFD